MDVIHHHTSHHILQSNYGNARQQRVRVAYLWHGQLLVKTNLHFVNSTHGQREPSREQQHLHSQLDTDIHQRPYSTNIKSC